MAKAMFYVLAIVVFLLITNGDAQGQWNKASASYYGDLGANQTMYGACGYGDLFKQGYGVATAAVSTVLFNGGLTCGACYQVRCTESTYCTPTIITVTATHFCGPNVAKADDNGGGDWCGPPRQHFQLSMPMFVKIVSDYYEVGFVPVEYRRVPCVRKGGMRFEITPFQNSTLVLVYNVGGAGDVTAVSVRGSKTEWTKMSRKWGQNWLTDLHLAGQSLSFQVTASDGKTVESIDAVPANWQFHQNFEGANFKWCCWNNP